MELAREEISLELLEAELPRQTLIHTRWLHADSLAAHYQVPVLSIEHNRILRNFIALAARHFRRSSDFRSHHSNR